MVTPEHITPAWYFGAFYAILRAIPDKLLGVIGMFGAVADHVLRCPGWTARRSSRCGYKGPIFKIALALFTVAFVALNYYGMQPPTEIGHAGCHASERSSTLRSSC